MVGWETPVSVDSAAAASASTERGRRSLRGPAASTPFAAGVVALAFVALPLDRALVAAFAGAVLVVLSAIDIERRVIPNRIVLPAAAVVLVMQIALFPDQALEWTLAAILTALALMIPQLLGRSWMGMGDVKLGLLLGATLGWGVVGAVLIGFTCTLPISLLILFRGGLAARSTMIPFGPFLALGALVVLFGPALLGLSTG
jgi:leader peptidase (prepilin peptidase) / N-methyltransferase